MYRPLMIFLWTYLWTYTPNRFNYEYNTSLYEIHDVPGGKNDRREWISLLNNVSILMFVINLDGYHRVYRNDCRYPREDMRDTIELLGGLLRYTQMTKCLILIFNKIDLLEESIMHIDFKKRFSDFEGDTHNKVEIINFILRKCFDEIARGKDKRPPNVTQIHCFVANALNTECIKNVFDYIHLNVIDSLSRITESDKTHSIQLFPCYYHNLCYPVFKKTDCCHGWHLIILH
eukprot:21985_1